MLQLRIPPELKNVQKAVVPITGIDKAPNAENHDPSNVIQHGGKYYVWYTEHVPNAPESPGCYIKYATSEDGLHWQVEGIAMGKGGKGEPDEKGVLTPYVVHCDEKWYMLYLALDARFRSADDWQSQRRGIWIAEADGPDGPWHKARDTPLLWPGSDGEWDELTCDNANPIYREGRWWLYYMGRKKRSPSDLSLLRFPVLARASGCPSAPRSPSAALASRPLGEHRYFPALWKGCQGRERRSPTVCGTQSR